MSIGVYDRHYDIRALEGLGVQIADGAQDRLWTDNARTAASPLPTPPEPSLRSVLVPQNVWT